LKSRMLFGEELEYWFVENLLLAVQKLKVRLVQSIKTENMVMEILEKDET